MKCKYCNADVEQDAQFCPNCGKDFSKLKKCVKCGELLDKDTVFCPHCGAEQPRKKRPVEKETSSKKWLWVIIGLLLLIGLVGGGYYYYEYYEGNNTELSDKSDSSVETGLIVILSSVLSPSFELDDMNKYFTEGYINYYKRACDKADKEGYEYPRIWWQESDSDPDDFKIMSVDMKSENEAVAEVIISGEAPEGRTSVVFDVTVKKENGKWLIDSITEDNENDPVAVEAAKARQAMEEALEALEKEPQQLTIEDIVAKAKTEGDNWTVDEWKSYTKDMMIVLRPMLLKIGNLIQKMDKNPDKMAEIMTEMKGIEEEYKPFEKMMNEFEEIAKSTKNGKIVMDDEEWGNALKKELGLPDM